MDIESRLVIEIPGGEIPEGADLEEFKKRVEEEMEGIQEIYPSIEISEPKQTPAPPGTTGIPEVITWVITNKTTIEALGALASFLTSITMLIREFIKPKDGPNARHEYKDKKLQLPADEEAIGKYLDEMASEGGGKEDA